MTRHPAIFLCNLLSDKLLYQMRDEVLQVREDIIKDPTASTAHLLKDCEGSVVAINQVLSYRVEQQQRWEQSVSTTQRILRKIFK